MWVAFHKTSRRDACPPPAGHDVDETRTAIPAQVAGNGLGHPHGLRGKEWGSQSAPR